VGVLRRGAGGARGTLGGGSFGDRRCQARDAAIAGYGAGFRVVLHAARASSQPVARVEHWG